MKKGPAARSGAPLNQVFLALLHIPHDLYESTRVNSQRVVGTGRNNFLFVGDEELGENLAGLYSLVATCEANGINPLEYLSDVLIRLNDHPNSCIDELLPPNWRGPPGESQTNSG